MKKIKLILLSLIFVLSLVLATACTMPNINFGGGGSGSGDGDGDGGSGTTPKPDIVIENVEGTAGLTYELKTNAMKGTKYAVCTGIGTATDTDIIISSHYEGYVVKEVKQAAFKNNDKITSVKFVNGMEKLNLYTFQNCSSLMSVTLPQTLKSIGQNSFDGCEMLLNVCNDSSIEIKKGSTGHGAVGNYACNIYSKASGEPGVFATEGDYETFVFPSNKYILKYKGNSSNIVFPEGITGIYKDVFKNNAKITELNFPASLTYIGKSAFAGCTALLKVSFPADTKIKDFGIMAFADCISLKEFNFGGSLEKYLQINFESDTANPLNFSKHIKIAGSAPYNLEIPEGTTTIKKSAFVNCQDIQTLMIPSSLETIEPFSFAYSSVGAIEFKGESSLKTIQNNAFAHCFNIKQLRFPKSIELIDLQAFYECTTLKSVSFENNNNLKKLGQKAFYQCYQLESVFIGHNSQLLELGPECFYQCYRKSGGVYTGLKYFSFGNNSKLETLGSSAFRECHLFKSLYLPATCVNVGGYCFSGCFMTRETDDLQLYSALPQIGTGWNDQFNSSKVDVFFGVAYPVLPEDFSF